MLVAADEHWPVLVASAAEVGVFVALVATLVSAVYLVEPHGLVESAGEEFEREGSVVVFLEPLVANLTVL